ncbi:MAG: tripartite tricarboxylate transporter TctB family protein [Starkeya sp.]|nr:tripartite tricarboxylate transporter TctB family protein [Starkeya sp.]
MEERGIVRINRGVAEVVTALVVLAAVIALFVNSLSLPPSPMRGYPGPGFIPRIILLFTGAFALLWLGRLYLGRGGRRHDPGSPEAEAEAAPVVFEYRDFALAIGAGALFAVGLDTVGFEITCVAITFALLYPRLDSPATSAFAAVATMLTIYLVFVLALGVSIPLAFLPSYITF